LPWGAEMTEVTQIESLTHFAELVTTKAGEERPLWFRGVRDAEMHKLTPSLFRHPTITTADGLRDLEGQLMTTFQHRAPPFVGHLPTDAMDLLFLMQHHGVPTRLLDCSENPFVALFFALEIALWESAASQKDAAVWIVDPIELNKVAFENTDNNDRILAAGDDLLNAYLPSKHPVKNAGKLPVTMFGIHNSRRIVSQRGVFVLYGSSLKPMEEEEKLKDAPGILHKLVIPKGVKKQLAKGLFNMGFTDSVIYPDLDGLGRELRNGQGFWQGVA